MDVKYGARGETPADSIAASSMHDPKNSRIQRSSESVPGSSSADWITASRCFSASTCACAVSRSRAASSGASLAESRKPPHAYRWKSSQGSAERSIATSMFAASSCAAFESSRSAGLAGILPSSFPHAVHMKLRHAMPRLAPRQTKRSLFIGLLPGEPSSAGRGS
jgi:hypothetical protein